MNRYEGTLNRAKMDSVLKRAYKSWIDQGYRCSNKNDGHYKYYGEKGIKRVYSSRDFMGWYICEYEKRESWVKPSVDRIDPMKNYCFENIQLIELSDNVKRRNEDHGNPTPSEKIRIVYPCGKVLDFPSIREASRETGLLRKTIQQRVRNTLKRKPKDALIITTIR